MGLKLWWHTRQLASADVGTRRRAVSALAQLRDTAALAALSRAAGDMDLEVRKAAVRALIDLGGPEAADRVVNAMRDDNAEVRAAAAAGITQINNSSLSDTRLFDLMAPLLNDKAPEVRRIAADALGTAGHGRAVDLLLGVVSDTDVKVRQSAITALVHIGEARSAATIAKAVADTDVNVRLAAIRGLGLLKDVRVSPTLISVLGDERTEVRRSAAEALATLGDQKWREVIKGDDSDYQRLAMSAQKDARAMDPLLWAIERGTQKASALTVLALRQSSDRRLLEPLCTLLESGSLRHDAWIVAVELLQRFGTVRSFNAVCAILTRPLDSDVAITVVNAIGAMGNRAAIEHLIPLLGDQSWKLRDAAAAALAKLGEPRWVEAAKKGVEGLAKTHDSRAFPALLRAKSGADWHKKLDLCKAMGELGDRRATEHLIGFLGEADQWTLRVAAADALKKLGDPRAIEPLAKTMQECRESDFKDSGVRAATAIALSAFGDRRAVEPLIGALRQGPWSSGSGGGHQRACAEALGMLKDPRGVEVLIEGLGDLDGDVRGAAAAALREIGETLWLTLITGDEGDLGRLCSCKDRRALSAVRTSVKQLMPRLDDSTHSTRQSAAQTLATIAADCPVAIGSAWQSVRSRVMSGHSDSVDRQNGDCGNHTDSGIGGVAFPTRPTNLDF